MRKKNVFENGYVCSLSGKRYNDFGNNPYPFFGKRCSDEMNSEYVIPARFAGVTQEMIKQVGGNRAMMAIIDKCRMEQKARQAESEAKECKHLDSVKEYWGLVDSILGGQEPKHSIEWYVSLTKHIIEEWSISSSMMDSKSAEEYLAMRCDIENWLMDTFSEDEACDYYRALN